MEHVDEPIGRDDAVEQRLARRARGRPFHQIENRRDVRASEHLREHLLDVWSDGRDLQGQLKQAFRISTNGAVGVAVRRVAGRCG